MVTTRIGMPLDEFIRLNDEAPFELIYGERRPKLPTIAGHSEVIRTLFKAMDTHTEATDAGRVYAETTYILPDTYGSDWVEGSRIPDLMFYQGERWKAYTEQRPNWRERPYDLVPDLVAEVVSPNDRYTEVEEKVDLYLSDGVKLVWVIDPQRRRVTVYMPDAESAVRLAGDAVLDGDEVLPGFKITLAKLFA